jgi:hypothetical protein
MRAKREMASVSLFLHLRKHTAAPLLRVRFSSARLFFSSNRLPHPDSVILDSRKPGNPEIPGRIVKFSEFWRESDEPRL